MKKKKQKKLYITGISGFIGSRLAKRCAEAGHHVIGISRRNCPELSRELGIEVIKADLLDRSSIKLDFADTVIHCATSNDIISRDFHDGVSLSVFGTRNLLDATCAAGIQEFIFFSTAQVYGTELHGQVSIQTATRCETPYALNHLFGEELCKMYSTRNDGLNCIALRPSNIYGVPEVSTVNRCTLVPICFVDEAIKNKTINLRSSGMQTRNFVSTDEVCDDVIRLLDDFPLGFTTINSGSNWCTSILEIARIVEEVYLRKYGAKIDINIMNDYPKNPNIFKYESEFQFCKCDTYGCVEKMTHVIHKLFEKYSILQLSGK